MKWFIYDRVIVPSLFPTTGSLSTLEISEVIREKLKIDEKEKEICQVQVDESNQYRLKWNKKLDKGIEVSLTENEIKFIDDCLKQANIDGKLPNHPLFFVFYKSFYNYLNVN